MDGAWYRGESSVYLWAYLLDDVNSQNMTLAAIPGSGFLTNEVIEKGIVSFSDAVSKIAALPQENKNCFYTYDHDAGNIFRHHKDGSKFNKRKHLYTFFWGEIIHKE